MGHNVNRRSFGKVSVSVVAAAGSRCPAAGPDATWKPKYILGSCMYGHATLQEIMPEVAKIGASAIDVWPKVHGNQREQITEMGTAAFVQLADQHRVEVGCITQYKLGPLGLKDEIPFASALGCKTIVTGGEGPKGLSGSELKSAVKDFAEKMKPHLDHAAAFGVTIAIENHGNNLIESPDSLRWLTELCPSPNLGIALAPYHLDQDPQLSGRLIGHLGDRLAMFYAWQHGMGCMQKLPKEQELLQMPGRGSLDFGPIVAALRQIRYGGWTEIFMHPVPRGIPILESTAAVTAEINR